MAIKIILPPLIFLSGFLLGNFFPKRIFIPPLTVTNIVDGDTLDLSDGDGWFCSVDEAQSNGFSLSSTCSL